MNLLKKGDTIGIVSPSHIADVKQYARIIENIESKGFKVKTGKNIYKDTYGYLASEAERAEDINGMVADADVKMVFFGGGYGAGELLPFIDYEAIIRNPKIFASYSDGTSILNAIHAKTGIVTYYGQCPSEFEDLRQYDYDQFVSNFVKGDVTDFVSNSKWHSLHPGVCEGELIGGYTWNFALMINSDYLNIDPSKKYILFIEDHEKFTRTAGVSTVFAHIEQNSIMSSISGVLCGHYSETIYPEFMSMLQRFGQRHDIPVAYCDDFGHGKNHAILPIGMNATLDTVNCKMRFNGL